MSKEIPIAFIVGSGRSGTTILGDVLGRHKDIINWYEPYFIWDWHTGINDTDVKTLEDATKECVNFIRREFSLFLKKSKVKLVIDKTPEHCFRIPFVNKIFPEAKWIHIIRDGRDVTLSIHREWKRRERIIKERNIRNFLDTMKVMILLYPYWRNRIQAFLFELKSRPFSLNINDYFNKSKWSGQIGYGPRFPGWQEALKEKSTVQFNALQWVNSLEFVFEDFEIIPEKKRIEVRYEDFIVNSDEVLKDIFNFLELDYDDASKLGYDLDPYNKNKWKRGFITEELREIGAILDSMLIRCGYAKDPSWWQNVDRN